MTKSFASVIISQSETLSALWTKTDFLQTFPISCCWLLKKFLHFTRIVWSWIYFYNILKQSTLYHALIKVWDKFSKWYRINWIQCWSWSWKYPDTVHCTSLSSTADCFTTCQIHILKQLFHDEQEATSKRQTKKNSKAYGWAFVGPTSCAWRRGSRWGSCNHSPHARTLCKLRHSQRLLTISFPFFIESPTLLVVWG